jgi:hypothetical protein
MRTARRSAAKQIVTSTAATTLESQARRQVALELREMLCERVPKIRKRFERSLARPVRKPEDAIRAVLSRTLLEDKEGLSAMVLRAVAADHLRQALHHEMLKIIKREVQVVGGVCPADVASELVTLATIAIPSYPACARPPLPRKCDLARMVYRYFGTTRRGF